MYDPFAQPQLPQQAQGQTVGMVPGVPGSVGLNPGGPVMTPGGGGTGAPPQGPSPNNALGGYMGRFPQMQQFMSQMQDWRGQRPDHHTFIGDDWRSAIQDWRSQRPSWLSFAGAPGTPIGPPTMMPPQAAPPATTGGPIPVDPIPQHPGGPSFGGPPTMYPGGGMPGSGIPGAGSGWRAPRGGAGGGYGF